VVEFLGFEMAMEKKVSGGGDADPEE